MKLWNVSFCLRSLRFIHDKTLDPMQVLRKPSGRFERENCPVSRTVIDHLHGAVLLDPKFSHYYVVNAAVDVRPGVRFSPSKN